MSDETREMLRREGVGAFVHELRTPLTSLRMVIELARRSSEGDRLVLDEELAQMMESSLQDLQDLAQSLQEGSWLERGKIQLGTGPADLATVLDNARERLGEHVQRRRHPAERRRPMGRGTG
ncbi:MAG: histidine kinase dimerization/phospho-acceptor domain-containing protein [Dehalococcoidia bacterium]|nr:histidine kinase dimerization/phospho-acceptor domain-containing protein [Dehalococcoidia bacterium]